MIDDWGGLRRLVIGSRGCRVWVTGNQKSGTTAVAALLSELSGSSYSNDPLHFADGGSGHVALELLNGQTSLEQVVRRHRRAFGATVVKDPDLTFVSDQLMELAPNASIVQVVRDPRENIRSILNRVRLPGDLSSLDGVERPHSNGAWDNVLFGRSPVTTRGRNYIETLANRWCAGVEAYMRHRDRIVLVRYEDFLVDKHAYLQGLARQLGLEASEDISDSVDKPFQGRGTKIEPSTFFGAENLSTIMRVCGPLMASVGYGPGSGDGESRAAGAWAAEDEAIG